MRAMRETEVAQRLMGSVADARTAEETGSASVVEELTRNKHRTQRTFHTKGGLGAISEEQIRAGLRENVASPPFALTVWARLQGGER